MHSKNKKIEIMETRFFKKIDICKKSVIIRIENQMEEKVK